MTVVYFNHLKPLKMPNKSIIFKIRNRADNSLILRLHIENIAIFEFVKEKNKLV